MVTKNSIVMALCLLMAVSTGWTQEAEGVKMVPPSVPQGASATTTPSPAEISPQESRKTLQEQYGGVITNNTITVAGQDFYQAFSFFWREKPLNDRYALSVHERPSARLGNQVWVQYGNTRVYQGVLPTLRAQVSTIADIAAATAYDTVSDLEVQRLLFRDEDLGPDEF